MKRRSVRRLAALLCLSLSSSVAAVEIQGVKFDDRVQVENTTLVVNGVGLFRYKIVFKVYLGALYLGESVKSQQILQDVPKRFEVHYLRSFRGPEFGEAGTEVLAENVSPEVMEKIRERLERMNSFYEDTKPGDRSALTYIPGRGTELSINGRSKGWVEGADFQAAYFQIWFGAKPLSESFKQQLLTPVDPKIRD
ncbi:MAG: chalcone isomerase family protein [Candidatus Binatia bacterium]